MQGCYVYDVWSETALWALNGGTGQCGSKGKSEYFLQMFSFQLTVLKIPLSSVQVRTLMMKDGGRDLVNYKFKTVNNSQLHALCMCCVCPVVFLRTFFPFIDSLLF